jgi:hypothetical protein
MADIIAARPIARYGAPDDIFPPIYGPIGIIANTLIFGGAMVGTDVNGNMISASAAACLQVAGIARTTYYNRTTDPSGGAAGAVRGEIVAGCFPFFISADGGAITNANRWQDVFVVDNQTVSLAPQVGGVSRLPAGYIVAVDTLGGPTNGLAWVQLGEPNPFATPKHLSIPVTLAQIQALGASLTGDITILTAPANFWLQNAEFQVGTPVSGGTIATATASLWGGTDAVTSILGACNVFTGAPTPIATPGTNPYPKRGGQAIKVRMTTTVGNLNAATAGALTVDILGLIVQ